MAKENEMYVVIAYKYGDREKHSYTVGIFDKKHAAKTCADSHTDYRGGKYACVVERCFMNRFENDDDEYSIEIYRTKSVLCMQSPKR